MDPGPGGPAAARLRAGNCASAGDVGGGGGHGCHVKPDPSQSFCCNGHNIRTVEHSRFAQVLIIAVVIVDLTVLIVYTLVFTDDDGDTAFNAVSSSARMRAATALISRGFFIYYFHFSDLRQDLIGGWRGGPTFGQRVDGLEYKPRMPAARAPP